jgi:hypothetical protein
LEYQWDHILHPWARTAKFEQRTWRFDNSIVKEGAKGMGKSRKFEGNLKTWSDG